MVRLYKIIRFLIKRKFFYFVRNSWPVWFFILNREGRRKYKKAPPSLGAVEKRIVADLKTYGIATSSLEELFPGKNLFPELLEYAIPLKEEARVKSKKVFLKNLFDLRPLLDFSNHYVKFALNEKVLNIISSYLKLYPKFRGYTLNVTTPMETGSVPIDSQRWHRDPEDKIVVKMFLYLTDVDRGSGPFTYVKGSHHLGKYWNLFPTAPPAGSYPPAEEVSKKIEVSDVLVCTGKAGTIIFCETSGLHKGGFATENERLMSTSIYATKAVMSPMALTILDDLDAKKLKLPAVVEYALS